MGYQSPVIRNACKALYSKCSGYLTSMMTRPFNISAHTGFNVLRPMINMVANITRSPAINNIFRSPTGILMCLGCLAAIWAVYFAASPHGHDLMVNLGAHLSHPETKSYAPRTRHFDLG